MPARWPPLWLAAAATASGWAAVYSIGRWIILFASGPVHEDVLMYYVAAETGLRYGWSHIYDQSMFRSAGTSFPAVAQVLDSHRPFASSPLLAWMFAPLTAFPEPIVYALWTLLSLGALVLAWRIASPYAGLARFTLLLLAIGLWPVLLAFYFGQPTLIVLALVASAWWLCNKSKPVAAGGALALATLLKPQVVVLIPAALLFSGRYRAAGSWIIGCAILGLATALTLGTSGLFDWWHAVKEVQSLPVDTEYTLAHFFGTGPLTYGLWSIEGLTSLLIAWWRRRELEIVFASGLLGTAATASYFHDADYAILVLAALLVLRTSPPKWHRLWLLAGVIAMQLMTYGAEPRGPIWDFATHASQLIWDGTWLGILAAGAFGAPTKPTRTRAVAGPTWRQE